MEVDQILQQWLADQVFESANHFDLQFTEGVVAQVWEKIQSRKLNQVKQLIQPVGKDEMVRAQLRSTAE